VEHILNSSASRTFAQLTSTNSIAGHGKTRMGKAIVIGGSVAGLLAARVLSEHAESVVVVERDTLSPDARDRPGVPQGFQVHTLLPGGREQLERLFPGFTSQAVDGGAVLSEPSRTALFINGRRRVVTHHSPMLTGSRGFLEAEIRRRTLELPNVKLRAGRATGLEIDDTAVRGVRYLPEGGEETIARSNLVVDAMGRASRLSEWVERGGWRRPTLTRMKSGINYLTGYFSRNSNDIGFGMMVANFTAAAEPEGISGIAANAVEGTRWVVTIGRYGNECPAVSEFEFIAACRKHLPDGAAAVVDGTLVSDLRAYHHADSRRRDFARLTRLPAGLVAVGDAVASFNPLYGQGISSAALHASCLSAYLCDGPSISVPAWGFFELQRVVVDAAWQVSTAVDAARSCTPRQSRGTATKLRKWAIKQVQTAAITDSVIGTRVAAVTHMRAHPDTLRRPGTVLRAALVPCIGGGHVPKHDGSPRSSTPNLRSHAL
jgi:2-polyprenyl-6-methoxyphenol hydroxylase-like FAD-dependent oxidoreductase